MLFFGSRCEHLCMIQFSLVSLIPGLLRNLQDCASPELNSYSENLKKPTTLRTSDRNSLLSYMGLPLQIFGKVSLALDSQIRNHERKERKKKLTNVLELNLYQGSLFGPYTPLQQLDVLADVGTKSYVVGSTNSLLLQQRDRYSDILINLDEKTVNITSSSLRTALQLSASDRRWIDFITQEVNDTWDDANPGRPKTMGYVGSEEFIRLQFEEYLLSLISAVKYHNYTTTVSSRTGRAPAPPLPHIEGDPSQDFGVEFVEYWSRTENYKLWNANTDPHIYEFAEPKHPCAGGLSIDDVQRRIAQQVQDLHLDERFAQGKEVLGRNIAAGREKASTLFNKLYADMEALREAQRKRAEEARQAQLAEKGNENNGQSAGGSAGSHHLGHTHGNAHTAGSSGGGSSIDLTKAQQTVQSAGARATAYMSSWASWAGEKRKTSGWGRAAPSASSSNGPAAKDGGNGSGTSINSPSTGNSGSWSLLGSNRRSNRNTMSSTTSDASSDRGLRMSVSSFMTGSSEANDRLPQAMPATPSVQTPGAYSSISGVDPLHDFPPDMIIRNLDEERPIRPPPKDLPPLPSEVLFSSPNDTLTSLAAASKADYDARSEKDTTPPLPELPREAHEDLDSLHYDEKAGDDESAETDDEHEQGFESEKLISKEHVPSKKHAPTESVDSNMMLLH